MSTNTREVIIIHESARESWIRDASSAVMFVLLIGIGILLESSAMQWVGAILGFLTIIGKATNHFNKSKMTITQARKRLDELEASHGPR